MLKKAIVLSILSLSISTAYATNVDAGVTLGGSSSATGGSATGGASSSSSTSNSQSNSQGGTAQQGQLQGQLQTSNSGGNKLSNTASGNDTSVSVGGDTYEASKLPASTAYAAPLTSGADTCMGSSSGGVQGMSFGVSVGTTWTDGNCVRLKNAKMMDGLGFRDVAVAMMCADPSVADAMRAVGKECPKFSTPPTDIKE